MPLLFLFGGTVFYATADGRLQIQQIPWSKEGRTSMASEVWREMMDKHYPNCAWLCLQRELFDRLYAYKRRQGLATWEEVVDRLVPKEQLEEAPA